MKAFLIYLLIFIDSATAQFYNTTTFTTKNGLASNSINYVLKDKKGFLWIATNNGLNRYDGNQFVKFQKNYTDSTSIGSNFIVELLEGQNGNIWINFESGFAVWLAEKHCFKNFFWLDYFPTRNEKIIAINNWTENELIIATNKSLYLFETKQYRFSQINFTGNPKTDSPIADFTINSILPSDNKNVWVCYNGKLLYIHTNSMQVKTFTSELLASAIGPKIAYEDNFNRLLYISTYNKGLLVLDIAKEQFKNIPVVQYSNNKNSYDPVYSFKPIPDYRFIYNTELNVGIFNAENSSFTTILPDSLFTQNVIRQAIADKAGNVWIATSTCLLKAAKAPVSFNTIHKPANQLGSFATVQCLPDETLIYTSIYNDPYIYAVEPQTEKFIKLPATDGFVKGVLRYVFADSKKNKWLSTENEVFFLKNNTTKWKKILIPSGTDKQIILQPRNFVEDKNGIIWLRIRNNGLFYFDTTITSFKNSGILTYQNGLLFSGMVYNKKEHAIWIAEAATGLFTIALDTQTSNFLNLNKDITQKSFERIASNNDSIIWVSDAFNGIFTFHHTTLQKKHFNTNSGLSSNSNESIDFDADGNLWTFSSEGVTAIQTATNEVVNLQHPFLTRIQNLAVTKNRKVYVATNTAIYWWETNGIFSNENKNKLYWDYSTVNNTITNFSELLHLNASENDLSLYFGVMNEGEPIPYNLQYKFAGENEWINLNDKFSLSFFRLQPGAYTLQIRLQDEPNPDKWLIAKWKIQKPFWQTALFWAIIILLSGIIVLFIFKKRIQSVQKKAALQQQITELETQALRAQMNPHFIFNCISSIDNFILEKDAQNASAYLNKFAKLIRNILDNSKKEVIPFWKDWETLLYYIELERLRNNNNFLCTVEADENLLNGHYKIPALIIQPYVENAIHHGIRPLLNKQGHLKIIAALKNNILEYTIEDNGVGRKANSYTEKENTETEHHSYGMQLSGKRIDLFNDKMINAVTITDLKNEDGTAAGTKVTVILKV